MSAPSAAPGGARSWAPSARLAVAYVLLTLAAAGITAALLPSQALGVWAGATGGVVGLVAGAGLGARWTPAKLAPWAVGLAALAWAALYSPLGAPHAGALRHLNLGLFRLQPSALWVLSSYLSVAALAGGGRRGGLWLGLSVTGAGAAAVTMPDLSVLAQVAAGLLAAAWVARRPLWALGVLVGAGLALAASLRFPYVTRRWEGFLDPAGHARGAGYEYRNLSRLVAGARWWGGAAGSPPRTSSPADDYWLASALWRVGRLPVLAWGLGMLGALGATMARPPGRVGQRRVLAVAVVAGTLAALAIHAAYNLGLAPITTTSVPLGGPDAALTAIQLFALGLAVAPGSATEPAAAAQQ